MLQLHSYVTLQKRPLLYCTFLNEMLSAVGEQLLAQSTFHSQCLREK